MKKRIFQILLLLGLLCSCDGLEVEDSSNDLSIIDRHIALNEEDFVLKDASGIRVVVHEFGQLPPAKLNSQIKIRVVGTLLKDDNRFLDEVRETTIQNLENEGLRLGMSLLMGESIATIYVPSRLAFGEAGADGVPPNSIVKYNVALMEVVRSEQEQLQFEKDTTEIIQFLRVNNIETEAHVSGIFYTISKIGEGSEINVYNAVNGEVKESLLGASTPYKIETLASSRVFDLIDGLKIGLPLVKNDGSATFFIPSALAYGISGQTPPPDNSVIKVDIKLSPVVK
jgi:FKBP-type peptidyl-prolyl cis-trans isomerase FkpA